MYPIHRNAFICILGYLSQLSTPPSKANAKQVQGGRSTFSDREVGGPKTSLRSRAIKSGSARMELEEGNGEGIG